MKPSANWVRRRAACRRARFHGDVELERQARLMA